MTEKRRDRIESVFGRIQTFVHVFLCPTSKSSDNNAVSVSGIQVSSQAVHSVSFGAARELNSNVNESVPLRHKHKMKYSFPVSDYPSYIDSLCTVLYSLSLRLRYLHVSLQHAHHIDLCLSLILSLCFTHSHPPDTESLPIPRSRSLCVLWGALVGLL